MSIIVKQSIKGNLNVGSVLKGDRGEPGATFTPTIDDEGNLSWTNNAGLENPAAVNIHGDPGHTPVKGVDYFTEEDKTELVNAVLTALPDASNTSF